jgi:SAM-dependent methyltransferase
MRPRIAAGFRMHTMPPAADTVDFRCNLCGARNRVAAASLGRETPSCSGCGSTVRFRAIGYLVARDALRDVRPLPEMAMRAGIRGVGLSDAPAYAVPLARCASYENTYFHTEPRLDIIDVPRERIGRYDFVIASDVFEHVAPPVARAFVNARALLRPGGTLILTVPFSLERDTVEHFPELFDWRVERAGDGWRLVNVTRDGRTQVFDELCFHGGPGTTLEMRLFSRDALVRELADAGFVDVRFESEPYDPFGIRWLHPWSVPVVARAPAA